MGIGVSLLFVAAGAILIFAVDSSVSGVELTTVGWILVIVGVVGALISLIVWRRPGPRRDRERVVVDR
jgi:hypothetical protein